MIMKITIIKKIINRLSFHRNSQQNTSDVFKGTSSTKLVEYWSTDKECYVKAEVPKYLHVVSNIQY